MGAGFFGVRRGKSDRVHDSLGGKRTRINNFFRDTGELAEVFIEHACQMNRCPLIGSRVGPGSLWIQDSIGYAGTMDWNVEVEYGMRFIVDIIQITIHRSGNHTPGMLDADAFADPVSAALPAGVDQKNPGLMAGYFFFQQVGVSHGMQRKKGRTETGGKRGLRFGDSPFGTGQFGGIAGKEIIHGLFRRKFGNGR